MRRHVTLLVALAVAVPAVAVGCNLVVDAGGYSVGAIDGAAPGDDGGQAEAGPATCGQGLATGPDFDQLVKSCVLAISCDPFFFDVTLTTCLSKDYLETHQAYSCLAGATTCADYFKCEHARKAAVPDCPNTGKNASCNATQQAINCSDRGLGTVADCPSFGSKCSVISGRAYCVLAGTGTCTETDNLEHCTVNNQAEYDCINGQYVGSNCATGTTCGGGEGGAGCYFNAPTCGTPGVSQCNGTSAEYCTTDRQLFTYDCARSGSACALDDAGYYYCVSPGCTTDSVNQCTESCSSDKKTLNTCIGGVPYSIDCTQYGTFTGCVQSTDTATTPALTYTLCQ